VSAVVGLENIDRLPVGKKTLKAKSMQVRKWIHINVNKRDQGWSWPV